MSRSISVIEESNISRAWAKAFISAMATPNGEIIPLVISVRDFKNDEIGEDNEIRRILDASLNSKHQQSVHTVANTIFPISLWNPNEPRQKLFDRHQTCWPRISQCPANGRGHYFHRFVAYEKGLGEPAVNQLEKIINTWNDKIAKGQRPRKSALQLSVFDPGKDHNAEPYQRFPCLHQVCFTPIGSKGKDGLMITGFYAR
jgi:hypothetical protein